MASPSRKRARHGTVQNPDKVEPAASSTLASSSHRTRTVVHFSYRPNNDTSRWTPEEAFRELVRRWRDDIFRIHSVSEKDIAIIPRSFSGNDDGVEELEICYQVHLLDSEPKLYLGHIRYLGENGMGSVEFVTRGLRLQMTGEEGRTSGVIEAKIPYESLENAILAFMMRPQNHGFCLRSGLLDWRFNFNRRGLLVATQHAISVDDINETLKIIHEIESVGKVSSEALPPRDTQFTLGVPGRGNDDYGLSTTREEVKEEDFRRWTKAALFLWDLYDSKSRTTNGEIILDGRFSGSVYYDDLLLYRQGLAECEKRPLKYGYNFFRENKHFKGRAKPSANGQAKAIMAIWNSVLAIRPMLAAELSDMLNSTTTDYADVAGAETDLSYESAVLLRRHLLGGSSKHLWYFSAKEKAEDPEFDETIQRLGREGKQLTRRYWSIMSRHRLLNTLEEELRKRPIDDTIVSDAEVAASAFAAEMHRLSVACLSLCTPIEDYGLLFTRDVDFGDLIYFDHEMKAVEIPERWLDKGLVMEDLEIPQHWDGADIIFHAVYTLLTEIVDLLMEDDHVSGRCTPPFTEPNKKRMLSDIHHRLLSYNKALRQIRLHYPKGNITTALIMSGTALVDTGWARPGHTIQFQLHLEGCSHVGRLTANGDHIYSREHSVAEVRGPVQQNGTALEDARSSHTCQKVELVCPPSPPSYIYSIFEQLRPLSRYFAMAYNKSDPGSIAIALPGHWLPEKLSVAEQREAELANGRHFIGTYQCFVTATHAAGDNEDDTSKISPPDSQTWAGAGYPMMP